MIFGLNSSLRAAISTASLRLLLVAVVLCFALKQEATAQNFKRGDKQLVTGGILVRDTTKIDSAKIETKEELKRREKLHRRKMDSLARYEQRLQRAIEQDRVDEEGNIIPREPLFSDSSSLSKVCLTAAVLPGYGQIYNKQYWKLPILYGTVGASIGMWAYFGSEYRPLKRQYDELLLQGMSRTEELNAVQRDMIRANTKKQIFMFTTAASYIYFLGDAALNYSTNEVSSVKKATTLSLICPGAGQIYNKSYWRAPIVVGGLASMIYVIDWNNRGFQRFKKAYSLRADYEQNPDKYPNGSADEFGGRYSTTFLKNLRDSNRRNRDLSILLTAGIYVFQAIDAHVDAHLKDFDVSDNLTVDLKPMFDCQYTYHNGATPIFGFDLNVTF
ncbi:MAG: hypothetical protein E7138_09045 [Rikenellaceae bacterium]|nr:hypothetical protein [Rikenellaceae bacterium]MBQ3536023.1 hypothetical protein [Alistipes sp.]MBR3703409.1 hypothetical protein [Alistipes sp.]